MYAIHFHSCLACADGKCSIACLRAACVRAACVRARITNWHIDIIATREREREWYGTRVLGHGVLQLVYVRALLFYHRTMDTTTGTLSSVLYLVPAGTLRVLLLLWQSDWTLLEEEESWRKRGELFRSLSLRTQSWETPERFLSSAGIVTIL